MDNSEQEVVKEFLEKRESEERSGYYAQKDEKFVTEWEFSAEVQQYNKEQIFFRD